MSKKRSSREVEPPPVPSLGRVGQLLTTREVGQRLCLSRQTLWRMVREERLPAPIHISPMCIRWRETDIAAWVAER
jgi:predicted DNA-binding transcriptional regulator AlpA